jgi:hypothetical protein
MNFVRIYGGPQEHAPWSFEHVRTHRFIVPADWDRLRDVCDLILNDGAAVHFKPAFPFVTIEALYYGAMHPKRPASEPKPGCGMSQHELTFRITVAATDAQRQALGIFDFCPFIYVDNAWSVILGRESVGYPKRLSEFAFQGGGLDANPSSLEVTTQLCTDGKSGWSVEPVLRADYSSSWPVPGWQSLEQLAAWDFILQQARAFGLTTSSDPTLAEMNRQVSALMSAGGIGSVQLKQFLDPVNGRPNNHLACYKALVKGTVVSTLMRGIGMSARPVTLTFFDYPEFDIGRFLGILQPGGPNTIQVPLWWRLYLDFDGDVTGYF